MLVNLRQDFCTLCFDCLFNVIEQFPDVRFYKETTGIRFLNCISECIQTNDSCTMMAHIHQCLLDELLGSIFPYVQINLFFAERAPDFFFAAVCKFCFDVRSTWLSLVNQVHLLLCRFSVLPEIRIADEEIFIRRLVFLLQEILKISRMCRDMIDHEVKHQVIVFSDCLYICKCSEVRVNPIITHRSKATVGRRWKEWKNMHTANCLCIILIQNLV